MTLPIFLIGARSCGKSTVGVKLALIRDYLFIDTDVALQDQAHMTVAEIVEKEGWAGFRLRETATLQSVAVPRTVVATGGGIILSEENRQFMREKGIVIYLCAPASVLAERLEAVPKAAQRPTLTGKPISEEIGDVLAERDALYRETAHHIVDAAQPVDKVVEEIQAALLLARAS